MASPEKTKTVSGQNEPLEKKYFKLEKLPTCDDLTMDLFDDKPMVTNFSMLEYISNIPNKQFRKFLKNIVSDKISEMHYNIEWYVKSVWFLITKSPDYTEYRVGLVFFFVFFGQKHQNYKHQI